MKSIYGVLVIAMLASCGTKNSVADNSKESTCIDSVKVEVFDAFGRPSYITISCDSLTKLQE